MKIFFILILSSIFLFGASKTIYLEVDGFGNSRDEAIRDALIEAIKQTKGVSIDSKKLFSKKLEQRSSSLNGNSTQKIKIAKVNNNKVREMTKGLINSYRVLNIDKINANEYRAKLSVKLLKYISVGLSNKNRRKIAIIPFYGDRKISSELSQALTTDITQSRKFAVLDRTYTQKIQNELDLINSSKTPLSQKIKLGQKLGADYLLVGTIQNAKTSKVTTHNQLLGVNSTKYKLTFVVDYRIIVVGTSQVKFADTATINTTNSSINFQKVIKQISQKIATKLLDAIYPIKVIEITQNGRVILNQGGTLLEKNSIYDVFKLGKKLIDPYTKESLGYEEIKIATIKITKVNPKNSYGKILKGKFIPKGCICRKQIILNHTKHLQDNPNWRKTDVKIIKGGGVVLPF